MIRVLMMAVACVAGALVTWLFVPTVQPVRVNPDMPVFSPVPDPATTEDTTALRPGIMSDEKRRTHAEQLVGERLKYIVPDKVYATAWFTEQGSRVIEEAMDECFLVTDPLLYSAHLEALGSEDDSEATGPTFAQPNLKQARNCANVHLAYAALHGIEVDF